MSIYVEVSVVIDRPVEDVFRIHATEHVRNHPRWDPDMELEQITQGPMGVGTVIKRVNSRSGVPVEGTMEVTGFEPNNSMSMIIKDGPVEMKGASIYEKKGPDQTVLTHKIEFFGLDESVEKSDLIKLMEYAIQNHKRFIDSEP
jgi:uncharacterized protein YndB with AHSA1/START domain